MHRNTWKSGERRIARMFNTERTPLSGGNSRHTKSDTLHPTLFIEIKHRKKLPMGKLWEETLTLAKKEEKIPAVVFLKKGSPEPILMCKISDLFKISNELIIFKTLNKKEIEDGKLEMS